MQSQISEMQSKLSEAQTRIQRCKRECKETAAEIGVARGEVADKEAEVSYYIHFHFFLNYAIIFILIIYLLHAKIFNPSIEMNKNILYIIRFKM